MHRYFVTGTDTDVGKTRVCAALGLALRQAGRTATIVKLVQTGVAPDESGDAQRAGELVGVAHAELARFRKPADAWSAALAEGEAPLRASALAEALDRFDGAVVAEGLGGLLAPLNAQEHLGNVAALAKLETLLVVNLRLGCLNHSLLSLSALRELNLPVAGAVLTERSGPTEPAYRADVERVLRPHVRIFGVLPFTPDERESVAAGAKLFESLVNRER